MINREEKIKQKMDGYINQLSYKLSEDDENYLITHSISLFSLKNIENEHLIDNFLRLVTDYHKNSVQLVFKIISDKTTANKRKSTKKQNALKGADNIIDYLGGIYSDNENAKQLKILLRDFIRNIDNFEVKEPTHSITKDDLRTELRKIIKNKSTEIDSFVRGLKNYKL